VNALLSEREPGRLGAEASRAVAAGFRTLKLKVAAGGVEEDVARVIAVRAAVGAQPRLRLDANGGWKEDEALLALGRLAPFGIEMLEQPVDANDVLALARLRGASPVRIAADESATGAERAERVIVLGAADVICLKLGATGGLRAALRIADRAHSVGIAVFVTSGLDGAVARAAALQLAAALPGRLPACGLATGALLRDDLATCAAPSRGALTLPRGDGLGVVPTALSRLAMGPSLAFEAGA
jgi:L-alanine-DL-glutamate epimerase-like enolase superfamily enzyme